MKVKSASRPNPWGSPWVFGKLPWVLLGLAALFLAFGLWNWRLLSWQSTVAVSLVREDRSYVPVTNTKYGTRGDLKVDACATRYQFRYDGRLYSGWSPRCGSDLVYFDPAIPRFSTLGRLEIFPWRWPLGWAMVLGTLGLSLAAEGNARKWRGRRSTQRRTDRK